MLQSIHLLHSSQGDASRVDGSGVDGSGVNGSGVYREQQKQGMYTAKTTGWVILHANYAENFENYSLNIIIS